MIIEIDLKNIKSSEELHLLLSEKLNFPDYDGKNWAAFWDLITDDYLPMKLVFKNWNNLKENLPEEAETFQSCIHDYIEQYCSAENYCEIIYR